MLQQVDSINSQLFVIFSVATIASAPYGAYGGAHTCYIVEAL